MNLFFDLIALILCVFIVIYHYYTINVRYKNVTQSELFFADKNVTQSVWIFLYKNVTQSALFFAYKIVMQLELFFVPFFKAEIMSAIFSNKNGILHFLKVNSSIPTKLGTDLLHDR